MSYLLVTNNPNFQKSDVQKLCKVLYNDIEEKKFEDESFHRTFFIGKDYATMITDLLKVHLVKFEIFEQPFTLIIPRPGHSYRECDYQEVVDATNIDIRSPDFRPRKFVVSRETRDQLIPALAEKRVDFCVDDWHDWVSVLSLRGFDLKRRGRRDQMLDLLSVASLVGVLSVLGALVLPKIFSYLA